jgi:hypothetical protein
MTWWRVWFRLWTAGPLRGRRGSYMPLSRWFFDEHDHTSFPGRFYPGPAKLPIKRTEIDLWR